MRIYGTAVLFIIVAAAGGCTKEPPSEEEVIKGIIETVAGAAERKDIQAIKKVLSRSYRDTEGNDYDAVNAFLLSHFFRSEKIGVTVTLSQVTVGHPPDADREKAVSHTEAILTRVPKGAVVTGYISRDADYYRFDIDWQKEGGEWKVLGVSWGPMQKVP